MARLIDADALKKALRDCQIESLIAHTEYKNVFDVINEQPTAYDVDAVVEEIKKFAECDDKCAKRFYLGMGCEACAWNTIMELIRKGGVNDK